MPEPSSPLKAVRGTRDLLPPETALWARIEQIARQVFARYGFGEIRTPIFEATELFARGVGEETDIVSKEMYTWEDRARAQSEKAQSLTLRPENTAGVVRAYIEHKLGETGVLQKLFYIGPQFRRERPQRGRYRQFWQIGCEVLGPPTSGSESPIRDAEVLEMLATLLDELGVRNWQLDLNSVGSTDDRKRYNAALREALAPVKHKLCEDNQRRAETNPLRVLDSKDPADQEIIDTLPKIADYLDADSRSHFASVLSALDACDVPYIVNPRLVRGLDYYTRTTFEFTVPSSVDDPSSGLGTQNALLGGGRYDGLSEMLGGPRAPGIGFAIGEDRLVLTLQAQASTAVNAPHPEALWVPKLDAYIAPMGVEQNPAALALARELRRAGLSIEVGDGSFKAGKSKEVAELKARRIVFVGALESDAGLFFAEDFRTDQVRPLSRKELPIELHKPNWPINDQLVRSSNPLEQALAIRMAILLVLEASEKPMSDESLRIFSALSLREPPRRLLAESIQRATTDLKAERFVELQENGWVITNAGRNHANQQLALESGTKEGGSADL